MKCVIVLTSLVLTIVIVSSISAQNPTVKTQPVDYSAGGVTLEGFVAYDSAKKSPQPGVLIIHDWMGPGKFANDKAQELANLGYVAFAVDVYGKGVRPKDA